MAESEFIWPKCKEVQNETKLIAIAEGFSYIVHAQNRLRIKSLTRWKWLMTHIQNVLKDVFLSSHSFLYTYMMRRSLEWDGEIIINYS